MQPNAQGQCFSYYGTWNVKDKPKRGVHYFMIDEYVKNTVEKEKENFNKEIIKTFDSFNKSIKKLLEKSTEQVKSVHESIGDMTKFMYKVIDLNGLKEPEVEKKPKKKKVKKKPKEKEVEVDDGYL
jgi:hypothetical protein